MNRRRWLISLVWLSTWLLVANVARAQTSSDYDLSWSLLGGTGGARSSAAFAVQDVVGQSAAGAISSANYAIVAGWIGGINQGARPGVGDAYEVDDDCASATDIQTTGLKQEHTFHDQDDQDWLKFTAQAGKTYVIQVKNIGAASDAIISLYDTCALPPAGQGSNAFGDTVTLNWNSTKNGDYFVKLQQFDSSFYGADVNYEVSVAIDNVPPTAPTNPRCVAVNDTTLGIQWDRSPEFDVKQYRIPFTGPKSGSADVFGANSTYYELGELFPNQTYNFRVIAVDYSSNESDPSGAVDCLTQDPVDFTVPTFALAQPGSGVYTTTAGALTFTGDAQDAGKNLSRARVRNVTRDSEKWDESLSGASDDFRVQDLPLGVGVNQIDVTVYDAAGNTKTQTVQVQRLGQAAGAVVIIAGHNDTFGLQTNITNAANRAYRIFKGAGFDDDDIYYISTGAVQDADADGTNDVDATATPGAVQNAITTWAAEGGRVGPQKPLFVYMMDHGFLEKFCVNGCGGSGIVTPDVLDGWLGDLEQATGVDELNIIIEACQSGSFMDLKSAPAKYDSLSKPGRVVITSTGRDNNAYASAEGAYFSDAFFSCIADSSSLKACYDQALAAVQVTGQNQTPWLDDNGDNVSDSKDGTVAQNRYVTHFFSSIRPQILSTEVQESGADGTLVATISEGAEPIDLVWATVYPPSFKEPANVTLNLQVPTVRLEKDPKVNGRYTFNYINGFSEEGDYRVIFYAQDSEGIQAIPKLEGEGASLYLPALQTKGAVSAALSQSADEPQTGEQEPDWKQFAPMISKP